MFFFSFFISTKCSSLSRRDLCETIQVEINEKTYPEHNDYIDLLPDLVEQLGPFKMMEKCLLFLSLIPSSLKPHYNHLESFIVALSSVRFMSEATKLSHPIENNQMCGHLFFQSDTNFR